MCCPNTRGLPKTRRSAAPSLCCSDQEGGSKCSSLHSQYHCMHISVLTVVNKQAWVESNALHALGLLQRLVEKQSVGPASAMTLHLQCSVELL